MPDPSLSSLLDVVHQIEPVIRAHAADAKRERRLSAPVAAAMRAAGLYRMWRPKALGGLEVDPITAFQILEEVARIDSAAGWNLQLSTAVDALGAWFPDDGATEIFGHPEASFAGGFSPSAGQSRLTAGTASPDKRRSPAVRTRQPGSTVWRTSMTARRSGSTKMNLPVTIITMCPAADVVIVDTWRTMGMRGTGSHDAVMNDVFVPSRRTALLAPYDKPGNAYQGPLYKFTVWTAICVLVTVPLGIARAALDELLELARRKTPSYLTTPLRERATVHGVVGEADATLGAARAYLYEALREVWDKALEGHLIDMPGKMKMQQAATFAMAAAAKVVDLVQAIAGTTGVREEHQLQRYFRDVHTLMHHAYASAGRYESAGQYFLDVPIEWPFYGL